MWWPGLDKDIEATVRRCHQCAAIAAQQSPVPLHQWEPPEKPWFRLHADFAELHGKHYLIIIDAFSKWPEVVPMAATTATKTMDAMKDIFVQHGLPQVLVTDNGPPFTSQQFTTFLAELGVHHVRTPPYHPKSNGQAENFVRTFKTALSRSAMEGRENIREFLFKYRVTPHASTGRPPCERLNSRHYRSVLDLVRPSDFSPIPTSTDAGARERQRRCHDKRARDRSFEKDACVWMLDPQRKGHWKTGKILKKEGRVIFHVRDADGKIHRVHKDHLKLRESLESWESGFSKTTADQDLVLEGPGFPLPFPAVEDPPLSDGNRLTS
ncbi:uncharacterized protein K02A2.6-like [Ornithodoros turicata]|uniref:uncharacterized protein K02A2.6-like n=1 Tax=Ornithodoros turicata TaxID=34597 RepID=UPI00313991CB